MSVWRPADGVETVVAWRAAVERQSGPTALVLSRQSLPHQARVDAQIADISRGAYVMCDSIEPAKIIIIATGSEVGLAVEAFRQLADKGIPARVVSMPSADVFEAQDSVYRDAVLPPSNRCRLAVESAHTDYWRKWVGLDGRVIGMTSFGESGPGGEVLQHFGFTAENIVEVAGSMI